LRLAIFHRFAGTQRLHLADAQVIEVSAHKVRTYIETALFPRISKCNQPFLVVRRAGILFIYFVYLFYLFILFIFFRFVIPRFFTLLKITQVHLGVAEKSDCIKLEVRF